MMLSSFIYSLLCLLLSKAAKSIDQFQASCFPGCYCNATSITCEDLNEHNVQLFRYIYPKAYPNLDTLIITGNSFGVLPDENIFGSDPDNIRHRKITLANFSNNEIRSFGAQTFIGMPRVEYFYLRNNLLEAVDFADVPPLNYLTSLKLLDLHHVFGTKLSSKGRAQLLKTLLTCNHSMIDLQQLIISQNGLEYIEPDTFCHLEGLTKLILADNKLTNFEYKSGCLSSLHLLDLSGNRISTIPMPFWANLPSIDSMDLSGNPLKCDCNLKEFSKLHQEPNEFLNQQNMICAEPKNMAGRRIFEVESQCNSSSTVTLWHWIFLIVIAVSAFCVYKYLTYRKNIGKPIAQIPIIDMEGYSRLNTTDEISCSSNLQSMPSPVFV